MSAPADREPKPAPRIEHPARPRRNRATLMAIRKVGPLAVVAIIVATAIGLGGIGRCHLKVSCDTEPQSTASSPHTGSSL